VIDAMRRSFAERAETGEPPETWERAAVHALYLGSAIFCLAATAGLAGIGRPIRAGTAGQLILVAATCLVFSFWGAFRRSPPWEGWFASHLLWLTVTYTVLGAALAAGLLLALAVLILAILIPPVAVLFRVLHLLAWLFTAWFGWRLVRGYPAFIQRVAVDSIDPA
jgi:hypothetical protein